jgi:kinesin light chain
VTLPPVSDDRLEAAADRIALAAILTAHGRHPEARQSLREALAVLESVLGPDNSLVATALDELAAIARRSGDADEAAELCRRALTIKRRLLGADGLRENAG